MVRRLALGLTCVTGFSGLVYEVAWQKYLATLLGSHSEATAAVLALFLGGLSVGYSIFGRLTRRLGERATAARPARLLGVYGAIEAAIGLWALAFPWLFEAVRAVSPHLPGSQGGLGFGFDVALSALLVGPPAVLMGATIPFLTQALARDLEDATRIHALVYGWNTAGAFAGALCAGFWLVPALGLVGVLAAMGVVNLAAGAGLAALDPRARAEGLGRAPVAARDAAPTGPAAPPARRGAGLAGWLGVAGLVGFAMIALQTVFIRLGGLCFGASQFTFSMVVAVFVLCIALGSFAVSALPRIPRAALPASLWMLVLFLLVLYPELGDATYWTHVLRTRFGEAPSSFYPYQLASFAALFAAIGPAVILSGATLPLVFHQLRREVGELGDLAGSVYSANTIGSLLGALVGGYALLFWIDLHAVYRVAVVALVGAAALATLRAARPGAESGPSPARARGLAAALSAAALLAAIALPAWPPERLAAGLFRARKALPETSHGPAAFFAAQQGVPVIFYDDDPIASIAVREEIGDEGRSRALFTNGKSDGAIPGDYVTMGFAGLLPALLAEHAERAFVIGWGTGVSAGELSALDSMREVVVAEISPAVIRAAPLFDYGNLAASRSPKLRVVRSDAYRALQRAPGRFDVIVSEPSNPWVTGVEMLFSREFLEAARDHLAPGGVYAQWFHSYETDSATVALVLRTYDSVFENVAVWYATGSDLLLLAFQDGDAAQAVERLAQRAALPDFHAGLARCGIHSLPEVLAHELLPMGVLRAAHLEGEIHTLLHPRLSHTAARAFFAGGTGTLPPTLGPPAAQVGAQNSLLRRWLARRGAPLSGAEHAALVEEACRYRGELCVGLLASWQNEEPLSLSRSAALHRIARDPQKQDIAPEVEALGRLFAGEAGGGNGFAAAQLATDRFLRSYSHAAPFPRASLAAAWDRCLALPAERDRCAAARAELERRIGPLDAPPSDR